uniref:Uncharacterized protein n=1 Tax=Brassica oleracea TaxID=3712 RepID=A0A3P6EB73_BRAOL|nr:unnamed protein product [Brassica oleracea]
MKQARTCLKEEATTRNTGSTCRLMMITSREETSKARSFTCTSSQLLEGRSRILSSGSSVLSTDQLL